MSDPTPEPTPDATPDPTPEPPAQEAMDWKATSRKWESQSKANKTELDKALNELKMAEESAKKVASDVVRLQEEYRNEQQHNDHVERQKRGLDAQLKVKSSLYTAI